MKFNKALLGGSIVLLFTFGLFNLLNLIYNISMARLLTIAEYGILSTLISIILIFAIFSESMQTIISKYTSKEKNAGKVKNIFKRAFKKANLFSLVILLVFLIIAYPTSLILKINYFLIALSGLMLFSFFILSISRGVLQGKKRFLKLGNNMVAEGVVKLISAIFLVFLGFKVFGALLGIIIGAFSAFALSLLSIKDVLKANEKRAPTPEIYVYARPVFLANAAIVLFLSIDIILAKAFFSDELAGAYALASTISKIIFIGTQPISKAMFPLSAEAKRKSSKNILLQSLAIIGSIIFISILILYIFPGFIIKIYSGRFILDSINILLPLGIAMSFLSLTNLLLLYKLSLGKIRNYLILPVFIIIQIVLLSVFNNSLLSFSLALIASSAIFLIGSIVIFKEKNEESHNSNSSIQRRKENRQDS